MSLKLVEADVVRENDVHHRQATGDAEIGQRGGDVRAGQRGLKPSKVFSAAGVEFITGGKVGQRKVGLRFLPSLGLVCRPLACELGTGSSVIRRGKQGPPWAQPDQRSAYTGSTPIAV